MTKSTHSRLTAVRNQVQNFIADLESEYSKGVIDSTWNAAQSAEDFQEFRSIIKEKANFGEITLSNNELRTFWNEFTKD
jgi:hypothetical protein